MDETTRYERIIDSRSSVKRGGKQNRWYHIGGEWRVGTSGGKSDKSRRWSSKRHVTRKGNDCAFRHSDWFCITKFADSSSSPLDWHSAATSGVLRDFRVVRKRGFGFPDERKVEGESILFDRDTRDSRNRPLNFPVQFGCTRFAWYLSFWSRCSHIQVQRKKSTASHPVYIVYPLKRDNTFYVSFQYMSIKKRAS